MKITIPKIIWFMILTFILINVLIYLSFLVFRDFSATKIKAHFEQVRPFSGRADVFYKGYKVGRAVNIRPDDNYKKAIVSIFLYPHDLKLPKNIEIELRKKTIFYKFQHDYLEIILPKEPSSELLRNNDIVLGNTTIDLKDYLASQKSENLDEIKNNLNYAISDLGSAFSAISDFFETLNKTAQQIHPNIVGVSKNANVLSKNVAQLSENLNKALNEQRLDKNAQDIEEMLENFSDMSQNLNDLSASLNAQSDEINKAIKNTNSILDNTNELTSGLNSTLKKPFGGFRVIFGSPLKK